MNSGLDLVSVLNLMLPHLSFFFAWSEPLWGSKKCASGDEKSCHFPRV
jgi:hypothetical protein